MRLARPARTAAAAACSLALGALGAGAVTMAPVTGLAGLASHPARPIVEIVPGAVHVAAARPGAAQHGVLREALQDRVLRAGPDRAGLQPARAVPAGHHGPGPDDRHRGLLRIADGRARPGGLRQGGAPAGAAVAADHPARRARWRRTSRTRTARAGPARPTWTSSTPTRSRPGANILLVETPTSENEGTTGFPQIVKAEKYVISHHLGGVISQSFSATEQSFTTAVAAAEPARRLHRGGPASGVTVLAASGDSGAADVQVRRLDLLPAPGDVLAGQRPAGHRGRRHAAAPRRGGRPRRRPATVWNDTYNVPTQEYIDGDKGPNPLAGGGGKSVIFSRPGYQNGVASVVGGRRGVPDISMSGACNGAADMYQSFAGQPAGLVPDLRHQRGDAGVRGHRGAGRPGRRATRSA